MSAIHVECHAGYRSNECPLRFILRGHLFEVTDVEDRWYSPGAIYFRVLADDGNFYILRHDEGMDVWTLDGFRAARQTNEGINPPELTLPDGPYRFS
jgi:hypothetical protein